MAISKNSKSNRGAGQRKRFVGDEEVQAVYYYGKHLGHGAFMAGAVNGELILDKDGRPLPLKSVGELKVA
jgi:hypothetical protein